MDHMLVNHMQIMIKEAIAWNTLLDRFRRVGILTSISANIRMVYNLIDFLL